MNHKRFVFIIALLMAGFASAEDAPRPDHISIRLDRAWQPVDFISMSLKPAGEFSMDLSAKHAKFTAAGKYVRACFKYKLGIPIDHFKLPIVVMKYKAENLDTQVDATGLHLVSSGENEPDFGLRAMLHENFECDGQEHEFRRDLREINGAIDSPTKSIVIGLVPAEGKTASLEIISLEFEAAPDAEQHGESKQVDDDIKVTVTDAQDNPIADARVVIDSERRRASLGKTNAQGHAALPPYRSEDGRHMIDVKADGFAERWTVVGEDVVKGEYTIKLTPTMNLSGRVADSNGNGVEGVTVWGRIPTAGKDIPAGLVRSVTARTDADGKFKLPPLPDDGEVEILVGKNGMFEDRATLAEQPALEDLKSGNAQIKLEP